MEQFGAALAPLIEAASLFSQTTDTQPVRAYTKAMTEFPVDGAFVIFAFSLSLDFFFFFFFFFLFVPKLTTCLIGPDASQKATLIRLASLIMQAEEKRDQVLANLGTGFVAPMKQFIRVDLAGAREMQERLDQARQNLDEAQLRYDIARSSNKKKAVVEKLHSELESCRRQHSLLKVNLRSKLDEMEGRQKFDALQRLYSFFSSYGEMFASLNRDYMEIAKDVRACQDVLDKRKRAFEVERANVNVAESLEDQMAEIAIARQGYVEIAHSVHGQQATGRFKRRWMVATQGTLHLYGSWKDEAPKKLIDLVLCSVKLDDGEKEPVSFQLTNPTALFVVRCQTTEEADDWVTCIKKSIQYKLKKLQEEKRRENPGAAPDYLREMQTLSSENKLCADCGARGPEWASITLGVVICDSCSGVHRSLGTHISRIRSLSIDLWPEEQYYVFKQLGNAYCNHIWEFGLQHKGVGKGSGSNVINGPPAHKPLHTASREEREHFIREKYVDRRWLKPFGDGSPLGAAKMAEKLYDCW